MLMLMNFLIINEILIIVQNLKCREYDINNHFIAGHQWFMPVILATQEAEIRRIVVRSQPGQIIPQDPILEKRFTKKGWWGDSRCRP
jgi:hypothetical protein